MKDDLISRSALLHEFETVNARHREELWHITGIKAMIENQPTAYDVDKVDEQILEYYNSQVEEGRNIADLVNDEIEIGRIVRNGGKE